MSIRISRNSSCQSLKLPLHLTCRKCFPKIERMALGGKSSSNFKTCLQLWSPKYANHREINLVAKHKEVCKYLGHLVTECDEIVEGHYPSTRNKKHDSPMDSTTIITQVTNTPESAAVSSITTNTTSTISTTSTNQVPAQQRLETLRIEIKNLQARIDDKIKLYSILKEKIEQDNPPVNDPSDNSRSLVDRNSTPESQTAEQEEPIINHQQESSSSAPSKKRRRLNLVECSVTAQKETVRMSVPSTHSVVHKNYLSAIKSKAEKYDGLVRSLSRGRYGGSSLGDRLFATAASMLPQAGMSGVATVAPMIVCAVLANARINVESKKIISSLPGKDHIARMVVNNAVDAIILTNESITKNPIIYLSADKGNKKGNKNLAKYLCWYCVVDKRVKTFLLDVDCTDENSEDIARAIKHSLKRVFGDGHLLVFVGQCTDSGGGGTGASLFRALLVFSLTSPAYLVASCSLHNLQTALRNGVQLVLGEGGLEEDRKGKKNAMQLLHGAYNIQNWCENEELKEIYLYTREQEGLELTFKKLEEPIVTRWWLVGACACSFLASISTWTRICDGIRKSAPTSSASYKVAAATLLLIKTPIIISDVRLLAVMHTWFIFPHFKWCQLGDPAVGNTSSFLSRHMLVRYFIMSEQVEEAKNEKWQEYDEWKGFVESIEELEKDEEKEIQKVKVTHFLRIVSASLTKHFRIWTSSDLLFLSLFAETKTAKIVARLVLGMEQEVGTEEKFFSKAHNWNINIYKFAQFMIKHCKQETIVKVTSSPFVLANKVAIRLIADGGDIWAPSPSPPLVAFKELYLTHYSSLPTNSQFTERGVKESGYVSLGRRSEKNRSILATARAKLVPDSMVEGRKQLEGKNSETKEVQGKMRTQVLIDEVLKQEQDIDDLKQKDSGFPAGHLSIFKSLTCDDKQFKKERIDKKVREYKEQQSSTSSRGLRTQEESSTYELTPLLQGKIQYAKMKKADNLDQIRRECEARNLPFLPTTNWTNLINLIKRDEKDNKFFKPVSDYDQFKWNDTHFEKD